jgi:hypothetical protein
LLDKMANSMTKSEDLKEKSTRDLSLDANPRNATTRASRASGGSNMQLSGAVVVNTATGGAGAPHQHGHLLTLQTRCALRAYQLKNDSECTGPILPGTSLLKAPSHIHYDPDLCELNRVKTCMEFADQMEEIRNQCAEEGTVPLYHYTSESVAPFIFEGGFRMSTQGQGDGGVYFSTLGPSSYELGSPEYEENIIIDCFGKERLEEYLGKHKLDVVFVYGVNPKCIEQAPGGRKNAKMISKALFETFSTMKHGSYYARPDFIKGNFVIDGTTEYPQGRKKALQALLLERKLDREVQKQLENYEKIMEKNAALVTVSPQPNTLGNYNSIVSPSNNKLASGAGGSGDELSGGKMLFQESDRENMLQSAEEGKVKSSTATTRGKSPSSSKGVIEMRRREEQSRRAAAAEEVAAESTDQSESQFMVAQ